MKDDNIQIAEENHQILRENYYFCNNHKVSFQYSLKDHQKVEVIDPKYIHALKEPDHPADHNADVMVIDADSYAVPVDNVMNFANAYHPGGGYLNGSSAQEESLCRESTLYASIANKDAEIMYRSNKVSKNPFNTEYMLISPCVEVFRDGENTYLKKPFTTSVMTLAAPNLCYDPKFYNAHISEDELDTYMINRLRSYFMVLYDKGYKTITTGAWGCGAFGHDPYKVSGYFKTLLYEEGWIHNFDKILFAVKCGRDKTNYEAFKKRIG